MVNNNYLNKRKIGDDAEFMCIKFLKDNNIKIKAKNYRCKIGEIDIIGFGDTGFMAEDGYLIFFEVKFRNNNKSGYAESAVDFNKQKIISKVSDYYRMENNIHEGVPVRFDVLAINDTDVKWYKNAFEYYAGRAKKY